MRSEAKSWMAGFAEVDVGEAFCKGEGGVRR